MQEPQIEIQRISDGLGFGEGPISGEGDSAVLHRAEEAICSEQILVPVDHDDDGRVLEDDGCGDGRGVKRVFNLHKTFKRSLNRAKAFGGAVAMAASGLIGTGRAKGMSMEETMDEAIETLNQKEVDFGAHTDDRASGQNCGCGALDNAPKIVRASVKYWQQIRGVIDMLSSSPAGGLDAVGEHFQEYAEALPGDEQYSGKKVMNKIVDDGKVVKQLAGPHREKYIILNTVRGHTVNQELVRQCTDGRVDAFAVDVWRLEDIAADLHPEDTQAESQAYLSELVYTLGTAAVLTKGDLPVYLIR